MTRDNIIRMARENEWVADVSPGKWDDFFVWFYNRAAAAERDRIADEAKHIIKRAEARGAAAEREACAKVCDDLWQEDGTAYDCREAIRARGQA